MTADPISYVETNETGTWRIAGTRVSLDSIVHCYLEGQSPESIAESFRSLTLEQIHGALAFYLRNKVAVDEYLQMQQKRWEKLEQQSEEINADILKRIREKQLKS